jgi:hypothetical protein
LKPLMGWVFFDCCFPFFIVFFFRVLIFSSFWAIRCFSSKVCLIYPCWFRMCSFSYHRLDQTGFVVSAQKFTSWTRFLKCSKCSIHLIISFPCRYPFVSLINLLIHHFQPYFFSHFAICSWERANWVFTYRHRHIDSLNAPIIYH